MSYPSRLFLTPNCRISKVHPAAGNVPAPLTKPSSQKCGNGSVGQMGLGLSATLHLTHCALNEFKPFTCESVVTRDLVRPHGLGGCQDHLDTAQTQGAHAQPLPGGGGSLLSQCTCPPLVVPWVT